MESEVVPVQSSHWIRILASVFLISTLVLSILYLSDSEIVHQSDKQASPSPSCSSSSLLPRSFPPLPTNDTVYLLPIPEWGLNNQLIGLARLSFQLSEVSNAILVFTYMETAHASWELRHEDRWDHKGGKLSLKRQANGEPQRYPTTTKASNFFEFDKMTSSNINWIEFGDYQDDPVFRPLLYGAELTCLGTLVELKEVLKRQSESENRTSSVYCVRNPFALMNSHNTVYEMQPWNFFPISNRIGKIADYYLRKKGIEGFQSTYNRSRFTTETAYPLVAYHYRANDFPNASILPYHQVEKDVEELTSNMSTSHPMSNLRVFLATDCKNQTVLASWRGKGWLMLDIPVINPAVPKSRWSQVLPYLCVGYREELLPWCDIRLDTLESEWPPWSFELGHISMMVSVLLDEWIITHSAFFRCSVNSQTVLKTYPSSFGTTATYTREEIGLS